MSAFTLRGPAKKLLRKASRRTVEDHFVRLPKRERSTKWLPRGNRYRCACIGRFQEDIQATPSTLDHGEMAAYISASAPVHVIDGWSFLGRAVESTLRGDAYSAIHFGYYAELRAAMSLLAGEGIGILSQWHAVLDKSGICEPFPPNPSLNPKKRPKAGTHSVVWPILRYWSTLQRAADLIDDIISPSSVSLSQWLIAAGAAGKARAVAQNWLTSWGLDLAIVADDHDKRNLASYRPSEFRRAQRLDASTITEFVEQLWRLFEPAPSPRFPSVERLLLRSAVRSAASKPPTGPDLQQLGLGFSDAAEWASFLAAVDDPKPFQLAAQSSPIEDPFCHLQVVSRAALLLFVATSAARRLLTGAAYTTNTSAFWWARHGEDRGLWSAGTVPQDPLDSWADILLALDECDAWRLGSLTAGPSLRNWRETQSGPLGCFGGFELVSIWGLLP
jgi:hypothetical protein